MVCSEKAKIFSSLFFIKVGVEIMDKKMGIFQTYGVGQKIQIFL